ncbi:MAG TPA: chromate transporter [Alphaproteobacteria bacterium]|nr:chromate transporter [Alphaproteobacteria bacterium]
MTDSLPAGGPPTSDPQSMEPALPSPSIPSAGAEAPERRIGLAELFFGFASAGLSGFGGVMPFARRMIVEERRWMTEREFTEVLSLGQFLPGPNIANVSVMIGARYQGALGSVVALAGLMLPPFAICIALGALYARYGHVPAVEHLFAGITAAASGLLLGTAGKLARPLVKRPAGVLFLALAFIGIVVLRWHMILVLLALAPFSTAAYWPRARGPRAGAPKADASKAGGP